MNERKNGYRRIINEQKEEVIDIQPKLLSIKQKKLREDILCTYCSPYPNYPDISPNSRCNAVGCLLTDIVKISKFIKNKSSLGLGDANRIKENIIYTVLSSDSVARSFIDSKINSVDKVRDWVVKLLPQLVIEGVNGKKVYQENENPIIPVGEERFNKLSNWLVLRKDGSASLLNPKKISTKLKDIQKSLSLAKLDCVLRCCLGQKFFCVGTTLSMVVGIIVFNALKVANPSPSEGIDPKEDAAIANTIAGYSAGAIVFSIAYLGWKGAKKIKEMCKNPEPIITFEDFQKLSPKVEGSKDLELEVKALIR